MKIERINDNQIRCILNKQDLRDRNLQLSEFVYGSDKARELFSDMMQKASDECDFEAEDTPLMIEAIPTSQESLMLIITKIDNPEELDTRFSSFTPFREDEDDEESESSSETGSPFGNKVLDQLQQLTGDLLSHLAKQKSDVPKEATTRTASQEDVRAPQTTRAFMFRSFGELTAFAKAVNRFYTGASTLYKDATGRTYILCLEPVHVSVEAYNKACNIACEYGTSAERATPSYYREHHRCILAEDALAQLAAL